MEASASESSTPSDTNKSNSIFSQIVEQPGGTITRPFSPLAPPLDEIKQQERSNSSILIKDVPLDTTKGTYLRLYLPSRHLSASKLPIILFFHGGGFVLFGPDSLFYHNFCLSLSLSLPALIVSASYRLASENRLPAAYHDALNALHFITSTDPYVTDSWVLDHSDPFKFFMMGSSSGANIVYQAALQTKLNVSGLLLHQPYFGGTQRTKSETESDEDPVLPLQANDLLWRLALPVGADRDHEYCNPTANVPMGIGRLPRCLVTGNGGDPLVDRQRELVGMLERAGVEVVSRFEKSGSHAAELFDPACAEKLFAEVREFVYGPAET